jgi:hypothetical protein
VVHSAGLALWGLTNQQVPARRRGSGSRAFLSSVRRLLSPAPSLFELTPAERGRQEETARVRVDGRPELRPGARLRAELAALAVTARNTGFAYCARSLGSEPLAALVEACSCFNRSRMRCSAWR